MSVGRIPGASGIPTTTVLAKGDLIVGTAANAVTNLSVGSDGQTLVANSSATTGLQWQTPVQQNPVLNSAFQVWQRGTSLAASGWVYGADRWAYWRDAYVGGITMSRQVTNDTTNLPFIQYCARIQRTAANTSTAVLYTTNTFESLNSIPLAGKAISISYYARAGANYSAASNSLSVAVISGTGTDQQGNSFTGGATVVTSLATLTTTWQRFTATGTVAATATQLAITASYTPVGTAGANDYFEITGVQLEVGSVATPFHTFSTTLQGELAACQRYYWQSPSTVAYTPYGFGSFISTSSFQAPIKLPISMRIIPTLATSNALAAINGSVAALTSVSVVGAQSSVDIAYISASGTGTLNAPATLANNNTSGGYLGLSAEL